MKRSAYKLSLYRQCDTAAYTIQEKDLVAAANVLAFAFCKDPSIRYLLDGTETGPYDWMYFHCMLKAIYGKCIMLSADKAITSVLVLLPPYLESVPALAFLRSGGIGLHRYFGWELFRRSMRYENNCRIIKRRFATPQTWYCLCFAVLPQMQGHGSGANLIRPVLTALNNTRQACYLETHTVANVCLYKHLGFTLIDQATIPGTDTVQYAMLYTDSKASIPPSGRK